MVTTRNQKANTAKSHATTKKKAAVKADAKKSAPKPTKATPKKAVRKSPKSAAVPASKTLSKKVVAKPSKQVSKTPPRASTSSKRAVKTATPAKRPGRASQTAVKPAGSSYKAFTIVQYKEYKELLKKLDEDLSMSQLKEECRLNDQKVTGKKDELISRVAEGRVLGATPRCPHCGGGRPRFDLKTATYKCPGYMEDEDFVNCHKKFTAEEITRLPWQKS